MTHLSAMAMQKRMMLTMEPASTMRPANSPLLAEWQSAWTTKLLCTPSLPMARYVAVLLLWSCTHFPMFCQMINRMATAMTAMGARLGCLNCLCSSGCRSAPVHGWLLAREPTATRGCISELLVSDRVPRTGDPDCSYVLLLQAAFRLCCWLLT